MAYLCVCDLGWALIPQRRASPKASPLGPQIHGSSGGLAGLQASLCFFAWHQASWKCGGLPALSAPRPEAGCRAWCVPAGSLESIARGSGPQGPGEVCAWASLRLLWPGPSGCVQRRWADPSVATVPSPRSRGAMGRATGARHLHKDGDQERKQRKKNKASPPFLK